MCFSPKHQAKQVLIRSSRCIHDCYNGILPYQQISLSEKIRLHQCSPISKSLYSCPFAADHINRVFYFTVVLTLLQLISSPSADVRTWCIDTALEITKIYRIYRSSYGTSPTSLCFTDPAYKALFVLINENDSDGKYDAEILDLCVMFRSISRRFPFSLAVFRMFHQVAITEKSQKLPASTVKLFEDFDRDDWAATQLERIASYYPVQGSVRAGVHNMEEFFDLMKELDLEKK